MGRRAVRPCLRASARRPTPGPPLDAGQLSDTGRRTEPRPRRPPRPEGRPAPAWRSAALERSGAARRSGATWRAGPAQRSATAPRAGSLQQRRIRRVRRTAADTWRHLWRQCGARGRLCGWAPRRLCGWAARRLPGWTARRLRRWRAGRLRRERTRRPRRRVGWQCGWSAPGVGRRSARRSRCGRDRPPCWGGRGGTYPNAYFLDFWSCGLASRGGRTGLRGAARAG
jgi:hypothetical protein